MGQIESGVRSWPSQPAFSCRASRFSWFTRVCGVVALSITSLTVVAGVQILSTTPASAITPMQAPAPPDASGASSIYLQGATCPSAGSCIAVGGYGNSAGNNPPLVETQSGTAWSSAVPGLPGDAASAPLAYLNDVACSASGTCYAVGWYYDSLGDQEPLIETMVSGSGTWSPSTAPLPGDAMPLDGSGLGNLWGVACSADDGECWAVGDYRNVDGQIESLIENLAASSSTWTAAAGGQPAGDGGSSTSLLAVACPPTGTCQAVGNYYDDSGTGQALVDALSAPDLATQAPLPSAPQTGNADTSLDGVSCPTTGDCVAAGAEITPAGPVGVIDTLSGGLWGTADMNPPTGDTFAEAAAVECQSQTACAVTGDWFSSGEGQGGPMFTATADGSTWTPATLPVESVPVSTATGIACPPSGTGSCVAVGGGVIWDLSPGATPDAPTIETAVAGNACAFVNWEAPTDPWLPTTGFNVIPDDTSAGMIAPPTTVPAGAVGSASDPTPGAQDSDLVCGLTNGDEYQFQVAATNAAGTGPASGWSNTVTPEAGTGTADVVVLAAPIPATVGPVTYAVDVTGSGPTPTGMVTVTDNVGGSCTVVPLVNGGGSCSLNEGANAPGQTAGFVITASYSGDTVYAAANASIQVATEATDGSAGGAGFAATGTANAVGGTAGVDTVTYTDYPADPEGGLTDGAGFFDVSLSPNNTFTKVNLIYCNNVIPSTQLLYWDGSSGWQPVQGDPGPTFVAGTPPCITVTLDSSTVPNLSQLSGTPFATQQNNVGGSVSLTKSSALVGNFIDHLTGKGWNANGDTSVTIYQCATKQYTVSSCDSANVASADVEQLPVSDVGDLPRTAVTIKVGTIDYDGDTCGLAGSPTCYLVAVGTSGDSTATPLSFALPHITLAKTRDVVGNYMDKVTGYDFPIGQEFGALDCDASVNALNINTNCEPFQTPVMGTASSAGTVTFSPGVTMRVGYDYGDPGQGTCVSGGQCDVLVYPVGPKFPDFTASVTFAVPTMTVSKRTGVLGNYVETVTAHDFPINETIDAAECDETVNTSNYQANCMASDALAATASSSGAVTFSAGLSVKVGPAYSDEAGGVCLPGGTCAITVSDANNLGVTALVDSLTLAAPTLTVTKKAGVASGSVDTITAKNFPIGDTVSVQECDSSVLANNVSLNENCDGLPPGGLPTGTATATGAVTFTPDGVTMLTGSAFFAVNGGSVEPGGTCYLGLTDLTTGIDYLSVPITLAH